MVCPSFCDNRDAVATGTPIPVTTATPVTGINFSLARGATIAGRVTAESGGLGLEDVRVEVYDGQGESIGSVSTLGNGDYVTPALVGGVYYLSTSNEAGFINEVYPNLSCPGRCSTITAGEAITVATGQALTGKNFALAAGGRIAGTATASAGGAPLTSVGLQVYSSTGIPATEGFTDDNGEYVTLAGLPSGTYYLRAEDFDRQYLGEIYDNIPCVGCDAPDGLAAGTPIVVAAGTTTSGRNFQLARGGSISGRVVSAASGTGVSGVQVRAQGEGEAFGSDNTDVDGNYTIDGLPAGGYVMLDSSGARPRLGQRDLRRHPVRQLLRRYHRPLHRRQGRSGGRDDNAEHQFRVGGRGQRHRIGHR